MTLFVPPRPIRTEGAIAIVPRTRGLEAIIDADDAPLAEGYNWYALKDGRTNYAVRKAGRFHSNRNLLIRLHRVILAAPDDMLVDHRDCDGLNCRRANLRLATPTQNAFNRRLALNNTSGFKGVSFCKPKNKWEACIKAGGPLQRLGWFDTPEEAHEAYRKAASSQHEQFARLG